MGQVPSPPTTFPGRPAGSPGGDFFPSRGDFSFPFGPSPLGERRLRAEFPRLGAPCEAGSPPPRPPLIAGLPRGSAASATAALVVLAVVPGSRSRVSPRGPPCLLPPRGRPRSPPPASLRAGLAGARALVCAWGRGRGEWKVLKWGGSSTRLQVSAPSRDGQNGDKVTPLSQRGRQLQMHPGAGERRTACLVIAS